MQSHKQKTREDCSSEVQWQGKVQFLLHIMVRREQQFVNRFKSSFCCETSDKGNWLTNGAGVNSILYFKCSTVFSRSYYFKNPHSTKATLICFHSGLSYFVFAKLDEVQTKRWFGFWIRRGFNCYAIEVNWKVTNAIRARIGIIENIWCYSLRVVPYWDGVFFIFAVWVLILRYSYST